MFWKFNTLTSHIDTLLEKEDVTLREVLEEDDVLQECKAQNQKLVEFLVRPEHMEELVNFVTQEPDADLDEKARYKYPNIACELLTSEVPQITDHLANDEALLNKVYGFLESEGPLNPLQASFFSKVMGLLIARKSEVMVEFLQSKEDFVGHLLRHIGVSAIMDLLLRLVTCIQSAECRMVCVNWLNEQKIIQKLIAMIDPSQSEEKPSNAAQCVCDVVLLSREHMADMQEHAQPDPLLNTIEAEESICDLLCHMFDGEKVESVVVNGLAIIQTLLEFRKIGPEGCQEQMTTLDAERLALGVRNTLAAVTPRLKDFHQLLLDPPKQHFFPMPTTLGKLDPPLGNARLQVVRLIASLLLTNTHSVNLELCQLGTVSCLLDLYFKFIWNNFLHTQVESCMATILSNPSLEIEEGKLQHPLLNQLFTECRVLERILEAWEDNEQQQTRPMGRRRGYMGHLTKIANTIQESRDKGCNSERLKEIFQELSEDIQGKWETFVSGSLADVNKQNTVELVGSQLQSSSEDDDGDFRDIPFPQDTAMQQAFSDYQLQQMTSNFIDQFGFKEDEFTEQEESFDAPFSNHVSSINFDSNVDDNPAAATLFEQACNERMQQIDGNDTDEDLWETKEITFSKPLGSRTSAADTSKSSSGRHDSQDDEAEEQSSSDSEEDLDSPSRIYQSPVTPIVTTAVTTTTTTSSSSSTENMDVDSSDNWANFEEMMDSSSQGPVAMDTNASLPWESGASTTAAAATSTTSDSNDNWAKFDNVVTTTASNGTEESKSNDDDHFADIADVPCDANLNASAPELRGSIDIEMESSDATSSSSTSNSSSSTSRTAAYLVDSAPADLASQLSEATAASSSTDTPPAEPRTAWGSSEQPSSSGADSTTAAASTTTTAAATTTTAADDDTPQQPPPPPPPQELQQEPDQSNAADDDDDDNDDAAITSSSEATEQMGNDQSTDQPADEPDDLSANFNFLSNSGMLSAEVQQNDDGSQPHVSSSGDKIDNIRAQAKEALEEYTAAAATTTTTTSSSPASSQNGPV